MTEHEWLAAQDIESLRAYIAGLDSRRVRLFATACARRALVRWNGFDGSYSSALDANERYADYPGGWGEIADAQRRVAGDRRRLRGGFRRQHTDEYPFYYAAACEAMLAALDPHPVATLGALAPAREATTDVPETRDFSWFAHDAEWDAQFRLARCIFGNPFRPVAPDPSWLTSTVVGLAGAIYDARAFHDMPILADALLDAGCDDEAVLEHCRGEGPHVRGCFVIDMLTGRA